MPHTPPPTHPSLSPLDPGFLAALIAGHARLTPQQALTIYRQMPLHELGRWADARCRALHGDTFRTYIIDRNINYTNVCNAKCTFCAFRRDAGESDAYTLTSEQIHEKIAQLVAIGGTQILMQGGMNPGLPLDWYLELLSGIKRAFPRVHIHAFSPPELVEFVHFFSPPGETYFDKARWVLARLQEAGLDSLPGGGGEIFADPVRRKIGLGKCSAELWLESMAAAHSLGMVTSATMMFGHIEGFADRVHHMELVRQRQDAALRAGNGHYKAFISWPFQRENTPLGRVPDWGADPSELSQEFPGDALAQLWNFGSPTHDLPLGTRDADVYDYAAIDSTLAPTAHLFGKRVRLSMASDYLRVQALGRLYLDNIYSIGSSWVTMGPHIGQLGLTFGANDMGSVMMEENVVSSAGTTYCLDEAVLCRLIRDAGFVPAQRDNAYDLLSIKSGPDSPDLLVTDWSEHRAAKTHQQVTSKGRQSRSAKTQLTVSAR